MIVNKAVYVKGSVGLEKCFWSRKVKMAKLNITPPDLNECKTYEAFKRELKAWASVSDLPKTKQNRATTLFYPFQISQNLEMI